MNRELFWPPNNLRHSQSRYYQSLVFAPCQQKLFSWQEPLLDIAQFQSQMWKCPFFEHGFLLSLECVFFQGKNNDFHVSLAKLFQQQRSHHCQITPSTVMNQLPVRAKSMWESRLQDFSQWCTLVFYWNIWNRIEKAILFLELNFQPQQTLLRRQSLLINKIWPGRWPRKLIIMYTVSNLTYAGYTTTSNVHVPISIEWRSCAETVSRVNMI